MKIITQEEWMKEYFRGSYAEKWHNQIKEIHLTEDGVIKQVEVHFGIGPYMTYDFVEPTDCHLEVFKSPFNQFQLKDNKVNLLMDTNEKVVSDFRPSQIQYTAEGIGVIPFAEWVNDYRELEQARANRRGDDNIWVWTDLKFRAFSVNLNGNIIGIYADTFFKSSKTKEFLRTPYSFISAGSILRYVYDFAVINQKESWDIGWSTKIPHCTFDKDLNILYDKNFPNKKG